ncbi:MAG: rhomboid family intramembrane serine protease [Phycisphaerae bacterium]|nr:rhomboid family intramembrane serine protease [Phycisphaerae bacterium]MDD5380691.1 rhomboid family intramembrane serine protease [Phycisphaerae bacterium]
MILPIRTSIRPWRTPYANYALIIVNVICFLLTYQPHRSAITGSGEVLRDWAVPFMLTPLRPYLWQFVSYAFLHSGILHIAGNMFFLYLFGNNVNDKLGHINYLCLYLGGAVFAGVGHTLFHINPVLGASGAVAAVTGAYLVLFPQTLITVLYWFFFIGTMELSALYFIAFKLIVWDNIVEPRFSPDAIAYGAHLAGYAFGIVAILVMLATGLISSSRFDLWSMIKQWNQRRRYRDVVSEGYDPFTGLTTAREINVKEVKKTAAQQQQEEKTRQLRNEIAGRILQHNLPAAAEAYLELVGLDNEQILPRQQLLDIANQLTSESKHAESAQAYEKFLTRYSNYEYVEQVELMLGILYSRYLQKPELAIKHLQSAAQKLSDSGQVKMCNDELAKLQKK